VVWRNPGEFSRGPVPTLTKSQRERAIKRLQEIASGALAKKMARKAFQRSAKNKRSWRTKGRGTDKKREKFRDWARDKIDRDSGKVYVFGRDKKCRYVGRTKGCGSRPSQHFKMHWFKGTTRIDVYMAPKTGEISRLEFLAAHWLLPSQNKIKSF
jgi:hypothetical protein